MNGIVVVGGKPLTEFVVDALVSSGAGEADAALTADVLVAADLSGVDSHGVARLRRYVDGGGRVFSLGTDSLRREVQVRGDLLVRPTGESAYDVFGARIGPLSPKPVDLLVSQDRIGLFEGTDGSFSQFTGYEVTTSTGSGDKLVAAAQDPAGHPVIVAIRSGQGLVIRTGLASWTQRMSNPNVSTLTRRAWTLLSR
jgi:hypothetical protein